MSGTSPFLRRSCWAKSDNKTLVSTPPNIEVCDFESVMRGQDKVLSTKESALANSFCFSCFSDSIWCIGFYSAQYFASSCFVTAGVFKFSLLLNTDAGTRTNCSVSSQNVNDKRVIALMSCMTFSRSRKSLFCFKVIRFPDNIRTSLWNLATWCLFMVCSFLLRRFIIHSQRNLINSFQRNWRKRLLLSWENDWNTWRVERFCVFIVQEVWLFQFSRVKTLWGNGSFVCTIT